MAWRLSTLLLLSCIAAWPTRAAEPRDGDGTIRVHGELKQWHKVTLDLKGPFANESDNSPNPFTDYEFSARFTHESGSPSYVVPGYFAVDGNAANSSAIEGNIWRVHFAPEKTGRWRYEVSFLQGVGAVTVENAKTQALEPYHGRSGSIVISASDKQAPDFRATGRLQYVGERYLRFAGTHEYFLKAGADAPETLLAYVDFDGTVARKKEVPLKTWQPHVRDWRPGDPTWHGTKGKGLIGAVNYLATQGCNAMSFLPYNAGGDGDNVWPFIERDDKFHYDCSKLDQWGIVFDHAASRGVFLHFKLQENEIDDNRRGTSSKPSSVPESLDGGRLGPERRLYLRELIARFGYLPALNWNLGEENTQSTAEQIAMAKYIRHLDPYDHLIVVHTFPAWQERVYTPLLGKQSGLTGASLQNSWRVAHRQTLRWVQASERAGQPWVVCNDEQNPASQGVPPDPGYPGYAGFAKDRQGRYTLDDIRKSTLWGTLMAGGAGVEYYFGYELPQNDLLCEDFRSREQSWKYCRIALQFFREHHIPIQDMACRDELIRSSASGARHYCFAQPGTLYLIYFHHQDSVSVDLSGLQGDATLKWFNPRRGGPLRVGAMDHVQGGKVVTIRTPNDAKENDWLAIIRRVNH